jgi:hypothetical protein
MLGQNASMTRHHLLAAQSLFCSTFVQIAVSPRNRNACIYHESADCASVVSCASCAGHRDEHNAPCTFTRECLQYPTSVAVANTQT